jgi:hypothetical protein
MRQPLRLFGFAATTGLILSCTFVTNLFEGTSPGEGTEAPSGVPAEQGVTPEVTDAPDLSMPAGDSISTEGWPCYTSSWGVGFSFCYPPDAVLEDIPPDGARIDLPVAPGTNLGEKWLDLIAIKGASTCDASNFPSGNPVTTSTFNGVDFLTDQGADAGAGSVYEWISYAAMSGDTCVRMTFTLGSGNPLMYDPPIPEFDHDAETAVIDAILSTFQWGN